MFAVWERDDDGGVWVGDEWGGEGVCLWVCCGGWGRVGDCWTVGLRGWSLVVVWREGFHILSD